VDWAFGQIADQLADFDGLAAPDPVEAMRVDGPPAYWRCTPDTRT
jgi:hypothetical protein